MDKNRTFLSDLKLYSDFLGYREQDQRYETWEEACKEVFDTHRVRYQKELKNSSELQTLLENAEKYYTDKKYLTAQRSLQFRGDDIFKHNFRLFNCLVMYADKPSWWGDSLYLMLCGCGVGVNMMLPFINRLPKVVKRIKGTKTFVIQDTIQGWGESAHVLISSYCSEKPVEGYEEYQGYEIKFDYSQIREKGAKVGRRFKAPGPDGLKQSLERVEQLLNSYVEEVAKEMRSVIAYDIFMHLANSVLSGGIRRAACSIICSPEDEELVYAKSGNWRVENKQRERSNNSVGLIRNQFTKERFQHFLELNQGISDIGFVFLNNIFEVLNPCFEIGFTPLLFDYKNQDIVKRIMNSDITVLDEGIVQTGIQCCNLTEINGLGLKSPQDFYNTCKAAATAGTFQAGYTDFKYIKNQQVSKQISDYEALLGVSITGWANSPWLFDEKILQEGARIVKETNEEVSKLININPSARLCTVKPSGNASVILGCASGIHAEHSENYFRVMQLNKDTETAKYLEQHMPYLIEEGVYSDTKSDYAVFSPISNQKGTLYKNDLQGIKHLELIKLVKENWVDVGKVEERSIIPTTSHNVSNTVIIDDYQVISDYIFEHQNTFTAVSFLSPFGDKDWNQCPNTSVLMLDEIIEKYGKGSLFASGLIVDGLHAFNGNLWEGCDLILNRTVKIEGSRYSIFEKKEWIRRAKKFSKNYFKGNIQQTIYCLKDVHLLHKWETIQREFKGLDFVKILKEPTYVDVDTMGAQACSGGSCELI